MAVAKVMTKCPFCKETIVSGATRCKHCHADLTGAAEKKKRPFVRLNTFRTGFLSGLLFSLVLVVLIYFQFYASD